MRYSLVDVSAVEWGIERSPSRLVRRLRAHFAQCKRDTRRYNRLIVAGLLLMALAPLWLITGVWLWGGG